MRTLESSQLNSSTEIDRHSCQSTTNLSSRRKFAKWADICWQKPAPEIASIIGCDVRTAQRILAGQGEVPWCVLRIMLDETLKPD